MRQSLAGLGFCLAMQACHTAPADALLGDWQVVDVYCRSCTSTDRSDMGVRITLKAGTVHDPFGGGACPGEVGYRELPSSPVREPTASAKLNPAWTGGGTAVLQWFNVTCGGLDFISLALLPGGDLAYIAEGELTYRLAKAAPPKR